MRAVEMKYLRGACGITRWDCESNESMYVEYGIGTEEGGVNYGMVKWVKKRWFGHIERMKSEEYVKKVYVSDVEAPNSRGRPLGKWKNRVKEYMCNCM